MSEYKKLKEKFEQDLRELQERCPHKALSLPIEVYWAPGHSSGYSSRYCERCNKQMDKNPWTVQYELEDKQDDKST